MKNIILVLFLSFCYLTLLAENKSKLVVGVTLTNFYPEWFSMYSNELSENGIKRIIRQGQQLNASYDYFYSQSGVDHATIYTGLLPEEHGIISHDWYDRLKKQRINNVGSNEVKEVGVVENIKSAAPEHIQALSLGCIMKMNNSFSKVFSVAINPEEAVLSGGTCADLSLWYNENSGQWTSSDYFAGYLPDWLREYNRNFESETYVKKGWMPLSEESNGLLGSKIKTRVGLSNTFFMISHRQKKTI
ncbi:MAG: alkaline phosphatase family protein [Odoribacter sp.]|nr:alkaline phosphatase family protein [Odoribacter sp.]